MRLSGVFAFIGALIVMPWAASAQMSREQVSQVLQREMSALLEFNEIGAQASQPAMEFLFSIYDAADGGGAPLPPQDVRTGWVERIEAVSERLRRRAEALEEVSTGIPRLDQVFGEFQGYQREQAQFFVTFAGVIRDIDRAIAEGDLETFDQARLSLVALERRMAESSIDFLDLTMRLQRPNSPGYYLNVASIAAQRADLVAETIDFDADTPDVGSWPEKVAMVRAHVLEIRSAVSLGRVYYGRLPDFVFESGKAVAPPGDASDDAERMADEDLKRRVLEILDRKFRVFLEIADEYSRFADLLDGASGDGLSDDASARAAESGEQLAILFVAVTDVRDSDREVLRLLGVTF